MAKRFIDTNLFRKGLVRGLDAPYKLLWIYIFLDCDHAGIWIKDFNIASVYLGVEINEDEAVKYFNDKIVIIDDEKWFIPSFIEFQYNELIENNRAHNSVINILKKYKLIDKKGLIRGLQAPKDKDKDKDKDKRIFIPPTLEQVKEYFKEKSYTEQSAIKAFEYYDIANWHDSEGKPVKNWKQKMISVWFKPENKEKKSRDLTDYEYT